MHEVSARISLGTELDDRRRKEQLLCRFPGVTSCLQYFNRPL